MLIMATAGYSYSQNRRFNLPGQQPDTLRQDNPNPTPPPNDTPPHEAPQSPPPPPKQKVTDNKPKETFWDRTFTGGGFGLSFGNYTTITLSPQFGYRVTDKFWVGVGATYNYIHYRDYSYNTVVTVNANNYGGRVFARYIIWKGIFVHVEDEILNLQSDSKNNRLWINSALGGGGYQQALGGKSSVYIVALINFTPNKYFVNTSPVIRFGFNIGL